MIESPYMILQYWFRQHVWANVKIVNPVQWVQFDGVALEMPWKECCINSVFFWVLSLPLHIVEENCHMGNMLSR